MKTHRPKRSPLPSYIQWMCYLSILVLTGVVINCAVHMRAKKASEQRHEIDRQVADVGSAEIAQTLVLNQNELLKLQQENTMLRASLIEIQQKLETQQKRVHMIKKAKPVLVVSNKRSPQRVADNKKVKKKNKVIQISFDDPQQMRQ